MDTWVLPELDEALVGSRICDDERDDGCDQHDSGSLRGRMSEADDLTQALVALLHGIDEDAMRVRVVRRRLHEHGAFRGVLDVVELLGGGDGLAIAVEVVASPDLYRTGSGLRAVMLLYRRILGIVFAVCHANHSIW